MNNFLVGMAIAIVLEKLMFNYSTESIIGGAILASLVYFLVLRRFEIFK
jgi:hypothetical protein